MGKEKRKRKNTPRTPEKLRGEKLVSITEVRKWTDKNSVSLLSSKLGYRSDSAVKNWFIRGSIPLSVQKLLLPILGKSA